MNEAVSEDFMKQEYRSADLSERVDVPEPSRSAVAAVAREVLRGIDLMALEWRHHGLGMLQAELSADVRVHVWHPELRVLVYGDYRDVHDHRFTLLSYVAAGEIHDVPFDVVSLGYGKHGPVGLDDRPMASVYEIAHAKEQKEGESVSRYIGAARVRPGEAIRLGSGSVYGVRRRKFHTTRAYALAVTVVHRSDFDDAPARVLAPWPRPKKVESGIVPVSSESRLTRAFVLREAQYALDANLA